MAIDVVNTFEALLADDEPPAFEIVNAGGASNLVLVCDHASRRVPRALDHLGLTPEQLDDHIGWDPGAAEVARRLSSNLDAPLILSGYSRLVIDCNRPLHSSQSIAEQSADVFIPGNQHLSEAARASRIYSLFMPYHTAIHKLLDARQHKPSLLLSIHSFTPVLHDVRRPWNIGVSYWKDKRFAQLLRYALQQRGDLVIGDNQPYAIDPEFDYAIPVHGEGRGLACAMIEMRQNDILSAAGIADYAERLTQAFKWSEAIMLTP